MCWARHTYRGVFCWKCLWRILRWFELLQDHQTEMLRLMEAGILQLNLVPGDEVGFHSLVTALIGVGADTHAALQLIAGEEDIDHEHGEGVEDFPTVLGVTAGFLQIHKENRRAAGY